MALSLFGGLTHDEAGDVRSVSSDTVIRDWKIVRIWLLRELQKVARR